MISQQARVVFVMKSPREVEVGRYYQVPCIWMRGIYIPIIGSKHEDAEFLHFPYQHWHYDPRFMSDIAVKRNLKYSTHVLTVIAMSIPEVRVPTLRRKKCYRLMPDFPWQTAPWLAELEAAYACSRVDLHQPVCPHRGIPLVGTPDQDGVVVCSGHGLSWDLRTGRLVPRREP